MSMNDEHEHEFVYQRKSDGRIEAELWVCRCGVVDNFKISWDNHL